MLVVLPVPQHEQEALAVMLVVVAPVATPTKTEALEGLHQRQVQHQQFVLDLAKQGQLEVNLSDR